MLFFKSFCHHWNIYCLRPNKTASYEAWEPTRWKFLFPKESRTQEARPGKFMNLSILPIKRCVIFPRVSLEVSIECWLPSEAGAGVAQWVLFRMFYCTKSKWNCNWIAPNSKRIWDQNYPSKMHDILADKGWNWRLWGPLCLIGGSLNAQAWAYKTSMILHLFLC